MKIDNIIVSGIGALLPFECQNDKDLLSYRPRERINEINEDRVQQKLNPRQLKRMDKFSAIALHAIKDAFDDAHFSRSLDKAGLCIGNVFGGWSYVEDQMHSLYQGDHAAINAYVATAWFPAAPQGEVSILYGYGGYSKTISADTLSAAFAIEHGISLLMSGTLAIACCGGAEAPVNSIILNTLSADQHLADSGVFFCLSKDDRSWSSNQYKFSIEKLAISRDIDSLLRIYSEEIASIRTVVKSNTINQIFNDKNTYITEEIVGNTYGTAFAVDMYLAYIAAKEHSGKSFVMRQGSDGQYAAALISIKQRTGD